MINKKRGEAMKIILIFLILFNSLSFASALGITPARTTLDFEPGLHKEISYSILNSEGKDMGVVIFVRGNLENSVTLLKTYEDFLASEDSKSFKYIIDLPGDLPPGLHQAEIVAMEVPKNYDDSGVIVGATVAVITQLHVYVPYPGKYLELDSQILNAYEDGTVLFLISATNRGEVDVVDGKAIVDIYNSNGEKVAVAESESREIKNGERVELLAKWSGNVSVGDYNAKIAVVYDGEIATSEKEFNIGKRYLEIQKIEVNDFKLGGIAKFNVLVENKWTDNVDGAYLNLLIYNNEDKVMADIKSQTYDIASSSKENMIAYWDTAGVKKGTYRGKLSLNYGEGSFDREVSVRVSDEEILVMGISGEVIVERIKGSNFQKFLIIAVVILAVLNVVWFIVIRKLIAKRKSGKNIGKFALSRSK